MINRKKRHIWPVALVAVLAVAGLMAALIVLASPLGTAQAQGLCDDASGPTLEALIEAGVCQADDGTDPGSGDRTNGERQRRQWQRQRHACWRYAAIQQQHLQRRCQAHPHHRAEGRTSPAAAGSKSTWGDDYQEPGSIAKEDVVFEVQGYQSRRIPIRPRTRP